MCLARGGVGSEWIRGLCLSFNPVGRTGVLRWCVWRVGFD